jgi:hypothetical protein
MRCFVHLANITELLRKVSSVCIPTKPRFSISNHSLFIFHFHALYALSVLKLPSLAVALEVLTVSSHLKVQPLNHTANRSAETFKRRSFKRNRQFCLFTKHVFRLAF